MNHLENTNKLKNKYFIMRHGESEANHLGILQTNPIEGTVSFGLTEKGRKEAIDSAKKWAIELGDGLIIFSSDFRRTRETAEIAKSTLNASELNFSSLLRERFFGIYDKKPIKESSEAWALDETDPNHKTGGCESLNEIQDRMTKAIFEIEKTYSKKTVLIVSHGDPLSVLELSFSNKSLTKIDKMNYIKTGEIRKLKLEKNK